MASPAFMTFPKPMKLRSAAKAEKNRPHSAIVKLRSRFRISYCRRCRSSVAGHSIPFWNSTKKHRSRLSLCISSVKRVILLASLSTPSTRFPVFQILLRRPQIYPLSGFKQSRCSILKVFSIAVVRHFSSAPPMATSRRHPRVQRSVSSADGGQSPSHLIYTRRGRTRGRSYMGRRDAVRSGLGAGDSAIVVAVLQLKCMVATKYSLRDSTMYF